MEEQDRLNILTILIFLILMFILWYNWTTNIPTIAPIKHITFGDLYYKHFFRHMSPSTTFDNMNANNNYNRIL